MSKVERAKVRIAKGELVVGMPVPWPLYDDNGVLLLARGVILFNKRQLQELVERGLFRKIKGDADRTLLNDLEEEERARDAWLRRQVSCQLDELHLPIGALIKLENTATSQQYKVRLIGYLKDESVLVTAPAQDGGLVLLHEGQTLIVRLFAGRNVYQFTSYVIHQSSLHVSYLHLTYPSKVQGVLLRHSVRADVNVICSVQEPLGESVAGLLRDLSVDGALLVTMQEFTEKEHHIQVKFKLMVDGLEEIIELDSVVRSQKLVTHPDSTAAEVHYGLQFIHHDPEQHFALSAYVYQSLLSVHDY